MTETPRNEVPFRKRHPASLLGKETDGPLKESPIAMTGSECTRYQLDQFHGSFTVGRIVILAA